MKKPLLIKSITLLSSVSLVIIFLLYRIGIFDKSPANDQVTIQSSPNGGNISATQVDTTKPSKNSNKPMMFSSSKVSILKENSLLFLEMLPLKRWFNRYPENNDKILSNPSSIEMNKLLNANKQTKNSLKLQYDSFKIKYDSLKIKFKDL